jgi:hypothetical protein
MDTVGMTHSTPDAPLAPRRYGAQHPFARRFTTLALACALLSLAGCPSRNRPVADAEALAAADTPLAWTVLAAHATHRLDTPSMETKEPAPGNQFVVLDVGVRNRDIDPQVLSEGKLIAMDESNLQTFDTPVSVLNDDYLSLQVLAPDQSMRGKIAYEVPEHLPGVLYWSPGNGSKRILLNVSSAPVAPRTLANADDEEDADTAIKPDVDTTRVASIASNDTAASEDPVETSAPLVRAPTPRRVIANQIEPDLTPTPPPVQPEHVATVTYGPVASAPVSGPPQTQAPSREVASIDIPPPVIVRLPPRPRVAATQPAVDSDQARRLQCEGLVSRDDSSEKARSLGFFAQSCREYALPLSWRPPPARRSLFARASDLLAHMVVKPRVVRVAVDPCSAAVSAADRLVCSQPDLAAMDRQLALTVARARDHVDDPAALQREQQQWRGRVRNACDTVGCLQLAYGRQIARVEALAPLQP